MFNLRAENATIDNKPKVKTLFVKFERFRNSSNLSFHQTYVHSNRAVMAQISEAELLRFEFLTIAILIKIIDVYQNKISFSVINGDGVL